MKVYHSYDRHREEGLVMLQPSNYHHSDQVDPHSCKLHLLSWSSNYTTM